VSDVRTQRKHRSPRLEFRKVVLVAHSEFVSDEPPIERSGSPKSADVESNPLNALWSSVQAEGERLGSASTKWATVDQLTGGRREAQTTRAIKSALALWADSSGHAKVGSALIVVVLAVSIVALNVPMSSAIALVVLIPAMLIDLRERRIPNLWLLAAVASLAITLSVSAALGDSVTGVEIILGALVMSLPILLLHLLSPGSMGFGDVKAAFVLGAALGVVNWQLALVGLTLAAGIGATVGVLSRSRTIAFGPYLLIGATIALTTGSIFLDTALVGAE